MTLRAYLVDDEAPALRRLARMLGGRVELAGSSTDPARALAELDGGGVDVAFLDIHMPGMTGLELAARLRDPPIIVFTTAYDQHALAAFAVNAVDYLLKPVREEDLERALAKVERLRVARPEPAAEQLKALLARRGGPGERIASRLGDRTTLLELARVTHFRADDKLTLAVTDDGEHVVDESITALERRLAPRGFVRVHRAALVNLAFVDELHATLAGTRVRLRDARRTELAVSRDRVRALKVALGL